MKEKISIAGSGEAFYLSKEMEDFAAVHYHYEQMGALVKLGYVDFPLVFEIVAFPDAYMNAVQRCAPKWVQIGRVPEVACRTSDRTSTFLSDATRRAERITHSQLLARSSDRCCRAYTRRPGDSEHNYTTNNGRVFFSASTTC